MEKVKIKALCPLRVEGKIVKVGDTVELIKSTADILVKNKQAELVRGAKDANN